MKAPARDPLDDSPAPGLVFPPVDPPPRVDARVVDLFTAVAPHRGSTWPRRVENLTYSVLGFGYAVCMVGYVAGTWLGY